MLRAYACIGREAPFTNKHIRHFPETDGSLIAPDSHTQERLMKAPPRSRSPSQNALYRETRATSPPGRRADVPPTFGRLRAPSTSHVFALAAQP